jgi:hypothetical protein
MEQLAPNPTKVATKWALIYLVAAIIITYIIQFFQLDSNTLVKYLSYAPFVAFLFLAQKEYKDQLGGYIKFGEAFSTGFRFGVFAGILFAIFMYIYLSFLSPESMTRIIELQGQGMAASNAPSEQIETSAKFMTKFGTYVIPFGVAIWFAILGIVLGLIGAAIFKKERSPFDTEPEATDPAV